MIGAVFALHGWAAQAATVGLWSFEEGTPGAIASGANSILDSSGNGNHGTPVGEPVYNSDTPSTPPGNTASIGFDGDDYVTIQPSVSLTLGSAFTVEFWMKSANSQTAPLFLVVDESHGFIDSKGWFFQGDSATGQLGFGVGSGLAFTGISSTATVLDGNWHHVAGVYDSADSGNELKLYIDGSSDAAGMGSYVSSERNINIGAAWGGGNPQRFYNGLFDQLRISSSALSPDEFLYVAATTVPLPASFLLLVAGFGVLTGASRLKRRVG